MSKKSHIKFRFLTSIIFLVLCVSCAFSFLVIKDFSGPLIGVGDTEYWEYTGFYVAKNLNLLPFPHLDLVNNQAFYPYGTNGVFQPWSIERDIFYAIGYSLFGIGPWLQIYFLVTALVTSIGTLALLAQDYGLIRASGVGLSVSIFNFYAIYKYPGHLSYAILHWTTLSIVADFLIVKRVTLRQRISLQLILIRLVLLVLSLGQELSYIAGFALMSFTVSTLFVAALLGYRYFRKEWNLVDFQITLKNYKRDFFTYPRASSALLGLSIIVSFINIPLILQISREAKSFDFSEIPSGAWWTHPLRLFIPFLPGYSPEQFNSLSQVLGDSPEGLGAGSPGWFLLILGTIGLWQARKRITIFVPLLIIFLLCVFYHPANFPTLKIFPWFIFNRAQSRCTVIYPVILCLFALNINFDGLRSRSKQLLSALLVLLACTELYTAYSLNLSYQPYLVEENFFTYMNYVKAQPGEAVLDWPFCAVGGNGVGGNELCPYYIEDSSIFALRRFHDKKVMGQYFGRLHPSQIAPYLQAGWNNLLLPDSPEMFTATRQKRCFRPEEWEFFTNFYKFNDFAGINLYVDLLPERCVNKFYQRFGIPTRETTVPMAGKVKFIAKSPQLRNQVNLALGTKLKFEPLLNTCEADLIRFSSPYGLTIAGLSWIEQDGQNSWRWALGPETRLNYRLSKAQPIKLDFSFVNPINNQDVIVEVNGVTVKTLAQIKLNDTIKSGVEFQGVEGLNTVIFKYKSWNNNPVTIDPHDERPKAILFTQLAIVEKSNQLDLAAGTKLKFETLLNTCGADLLQFSSPHGLTITGMSDIEKNAQTSWRWALGPETRLTFSLPKVQPVVLDFSFVNPITDQDVIVEVNGVNVKKFAQLKQNDTIKSDAEFQGIPGLNTVIFKYKSWNNNSVIIAPQDERPMAISFTKLRFNNLIE